MKVNRTLHRILDNRPLVHITFLVGIFVCFSVCYVLVMRVCLVNIYFMKFISLPVKMVAVYLTILIFIPRQLLKMRYEQFFLSIFSDRHSRGISIMGGCILFGVSHDF